MDEHAAFARMVCETPGDDTPRLVYADFLQENGEPERADFIRCGVLMAKHTDCPQRLFDAKYYNRPNPLRCGSCEYCKARKECERLASRISWGERFGLKVAYSYYLALSPLDHFPRLPWPHFNFARGFIESANVTIAAFGEWAGRLFKAHPITRVYVCDREPIPALCPAPHGFGDVRCLRWWEYAHGGGMEMEPDEIPSDLFDYLEGTDLGGCYYRTRDEALADLNRACVKAGRDLVGLPPLPS